MNIFIFLCIIVVTFGNNYFTSSPTWITSDYFRAGYQTVITTLTGSSALPQYTFTFSSPCVGVPSLGYGIKNYRGNDYFVQQFYQIRKIGLDSSTFSVQIQIFGITNLYILSVAYIAVQPTFPHHLNTFDNVPLNYSSGNIVNISVKSYTQMQFTETINYNIQAAGRLFDKFDDTNYANYKIVLFITSLWIRGDYGIPVRIHVTPTIINQTYYQWTATTEFMITVTKLQFSQIIFNQKDVESSNKYFIVYQEWITDLNGGFKAIPIEFVDNFIMAITDFQAVEAKCGFQYQWEFQVDSVTNTYGVRILYSWTLTNTCGFSWARSSIFYMKTWKCDAPYYYFNLTSNLCQTLCGYGYSQNDTLYSCQREPCQSICSSCSSESICLACDTSKYYTLINGYCYCSTGYSTPNGSVFGQDACIEDCGDGILVNDECDDGNTLDGDGCSSICQQQTGFSCSGGSLIQISTCSEICGDGLVFTLPCDDGNLNNGDGCSSTCSIQPYYTCINSINSSSICSPICGDGYIVSPSQACDDNNTKGGDGCSVTCIVDEFYNCTSSSPTGISTCILTATPTIAVTKYWKNPTANEVVIKLKIYPSLTINNISEFITLDFAYKTLTTSKDPITGQITLTFTYDEGLNSQKPLSFTYGTKQNPSIYILPQSTDNELTIKYYDDSFYQTRNTIEQLTKVLSIIGIAMFMVGMLVSRLIAIEAIFIFQFTYCGLIMLKKRQGLMDPLKELWITNGFNILKDDQTATLLPSRISSIYYQAEFLSNFNFNLLLVTIPIIIGLTLYVIGKLYPSQRVQSWGLRCLKEIQFTFLLFVIFQLIYAFVINFQSKNIVIGIIFGFLLFSSLLLYMFMLRKWGENFGEYKQFFKKTSLGQNFYIYAAIKRSILAFLMVGLSQNIGSCILAFVILVLWALLLIFTRPYINNTRPIGNVIMQILVSIIFLHARTEIDSTEVKSVSYVPLIIIVVLIMNLCYNIVFFILHFFDYEKCSNITKIDKKIYNTEANMLGNSFEEKPQKSDVKNNRKNSHQGQYQRKLANQSLINNVSKFQFKQQYQQKNIKKMPKNQIKKKKKKRRIKEQPEEITHIVLQDQNENDIIDINFSDYKINDDFIKMNSVNYDKPDDKKTNQNVQPFENLEISKIMENNEVKSIKNYEEQHQEVEPQFFY